MQGTRALLLPLGLALLAAARTAVADTVYRWTDERGVVHFADVPPSNVRTFGTQQLPDAPPPPPPPAPAELGAGTPSVTPAQEPRTGPAKVTITDREEIGLGDDAHGFSGTVKNEGGAEAREVVVTIRVVEPGQGEECLRDEIEVEPSTLAPGATGTFEADFTNPCFRGPTDTDLRADWE